MGKKRATQKGSPVTKKARTEVPSVADRGAQSSGGAPPVVRKQISDGDILSLVNETSSDQVFKNK